MAFATAFQAAAGNIPEQLSSGAYDSAMALMLASLIAAQPLANPDELTPTQIRDAMPQIHAADGTRVIPTVDSLAAGVALIAQGKPIKYDGASNALNFDAVGNLFPPLVHWKVQGQQFMELEAYDCSNEKPLCPPMVTAN